MAIQSNNFPILMMDDHIKLSPSNLVDVMCIDAVVWYLMHEILMIDEEWYSRFDIFLDQDIVWNQLNVIVDMKNHSTHSKCITLLSFAVPFNSATTTLLLSHLNSTECLASWRPYTLQLITIGASSFTIMFIGAHWTSHSHWN